jgi:transcriptional regulator with XRE-family HTH domain
VQKNIKRNRYVNYLPNNIYFLRKEKKMTQADLARKFGYNDSAITNWEADRRLPDPFDLQELSNIFNVSMDDLIRVDLEKEYYNIKKYTKKEVKEKVAQIVSYSELEENKKQMIINVIDVACEEML